MPKDHFYHIDLIRLISAIAIVVIHCTDSVFYLYGKIPYNTWFPSLILEAFFRWGTPLFIMISGYLLLSSATAVDRQLFYRRRAAKIVVPLLFWNIFYYLMSSYVNSERLSLNNFFLRIIQANSYFHMYFLYLIAGLYLITPWLKKLITGGLNLSLWVPLLSTISFVYTIGNIWWGWPSLSNFATWFILYIGYYLAGYWLSRPHHRFKSIYWLAMLLPVIGAFGDSHFIKTIGISDQGSWLTHRLSPLIALPAFALFLRLIKIPNSFFANFHLTQISRIADLSMGIYLLHPAVLEIYSLRHPFAGLMTTMPLAWISLSSLIILFTSIILVKLIKLIPFLNRTV